MYPYSPPSYYPRLPSGVWLSEPHHASWEESLTGLPCAIIRNQIGVLCGYTGVPKGHKLHGLDSHDIVDIPPGAINRLVDIQSQVGVINLLLGAGQLTDTQAPLALLLFCHNGLSYTKRGPKGYWWFGFDCGHSGDFIPGLAEHIPWTKPTDYRDFAYVKQQCDGLALQIHCIAQGIPFMEEQNVHAEC